MRSISLVCRGSGDLPESAHAQGVYGVGSAAARGGSSNRSVLKVEGRVKIIGGEKKQEMYFKGLFNEVLIHLFPLPP